MAKADLLSNNPCRRALFRGKVTRMGSNKRRRRSICKGDGKMKIIEEFIDSLFSGVVETSETKQLKADLLANAEDRYEDLLSQGKSENEAIGTIISEFGTIDELMEELNLK